MSKVVTVHGHTLELDMGPSCPNPGIRRQLDAKGEPYMCTSDLTTWIGEFDLRATYGFKIRLFHGLMGYHVNM